MTKFILFLMVMFISGCAVNKVSEIKTLETPPEMRQETTVASAPIVKSEAIVISPTKSYNKIDYNLLFKAYLTPGDKLSDQLVTFIYLPKKPTTDKENKLYRQLCEEWSESILSYQETSDHHEKETEKLVPFYWPLKSYFTSPSCEIMINQYDYGRVQQLMRKNKLDTKKVQFVALYKDIHIVMNVNSLTEDKDIVTAFQGWSSYMTKVPEKNDVVYVFNMVDSLKKVLGALEYLVTTKFKG